MRWGMDAQRPGLAAARSNGAAPLLREGGYGVEVPVDYEALLTELDLQCTVAS